jgi:hypothetical protein
MLCVFTLLMVQAFGGITGYLCRCGGQQSFTQADHCHGPHSEGCHDDEDQALERAHPHDDESRGDRENHEPVRENLQLVQASSITAPELMPVLLAVLPELPFLSLLKEDTALTTSWRAIRLSPPLSVVVGRTIVLLI